jgi:hypothetical protein
MTIVPLALPVLALSLAAAPAADLLRGKEVLRLDMVPGAMGAVTFKHVDHAGTRVRTDGRHLTCRDCHHDLATAEPAAASEVRRCGQCHAAPGEAERSEGGKVARALGRLTPEGALDYRSVLLHDYCRGCHKARSGEKRLSDCKVCHEHGITAEVIHGPSARVAADAP